MIEQLGRLMIKIISDSSTLYTVSEAKDKGFYSVPLHVTIGNDSYRDLEDISSEQLLKMIEDGAIPKTSQPSIGEKIALYDELSKDNEVIDITMAGGLSGTYQAALTAKNTCERPDKIHVVDSMTLCGPHRYMVDLALQMAKENKSVKEIIEMIKSARANEISYLVPFDFDFLVRGGRVKGLAAKLGGLLKLIPILKKGENGEGLNKFAVCKTTRKAILDVVNDLKEAGATAKATFYVSHANNFELADKFATKIKEVFEGAKVIIYPLSPAFISQGGPDCVAIQSIEIK